MHRTAARPSSTTRTHGSASNRNISSTRTAARSASPSRVTRLRRVRITPASASRTSARLPAKSLKNISTSASKPASTTKASMPKWPRASGNSRYSARAPSAPPTRSGSPVTCCCVFANSTASTSNSIASRSAIPTGTVRACIATSPPSSCVKLAARSISKPSWPLSPRTGRSTSTFTVRTTTCA
ncbi:hypothetical protein D3C87_1556300 [compost metagenome]